MKDVKFLYTDGRDVVVTQSTFKTKKALYRLKGITDFSLEVLRPQRLPGLALTLMGLTLAVNYFFRFIPGAFFDFFSIPSGFAASSIQLLIGVCVTSIGITYMVLTRKRYVLRIETAEGNKNAVVSKRREYVDQILHAIRKAKLTKG